jgi:hypothetical protein
MMHKQYICGATATASKVFDENVEEFHEDHEEGHLEHVALPPITRFKAGTSSSVWV